MGSEPRVLETEEAKLVSLARQGRELAIAGRFEQSELLLRRALKRRVDPVLMNDLGFVLRAQDRLGEAVELLLRVVKLEPYFLQARENLARTLYQQGELKSSLDNYLTLERHYFSYWKGEPDSRLARQFSRADLGVVYQSIAIINAQLGQIGEAICYSNKAVELGTYSVQGHVRFLVTLEELSLAQEVVGKHFSDKPAIDPSMLLDYASILTLKGDQTLALEALDRALGEIGFVGEERLIALLLRYLLAERANDTNTIYMISQSLGAAGICQGTDAAVPVYWPLRLQEEAKLSRKALCKLRA